MKKVLFAIGLITLVFGVGTLQAKDWKVVRIGVEGAYPPFSYTTADGKLVVEAGRPLVELTAGQRARVLRVPEEDVALLQYLATLGLEPQATVQVEAVAPFRGPLTARVGEVQHVLGRELASRIVVRPL